MLYLETDVLHRTMPFRIFDIFVNCNWVVTQWQ